MSREAIEKIDADPHLRAAFQLGYRQGTESGFKNVLLHVSVEAYLLGAGYVTEEELAEAHAYASERQEEESFPRTKPPRTKT
jgi:hypothetical protein